MVAEGGVTMAPGAAASVPPVALTRWRTEALVWNRSVVRDGAEAARMSTYDRSHEPWLVITAKQPSGVVSPATGRRPTVRPLCPGVSGSESKTSPLFRLATTTAPRVVSTARPTVVGSGTVASGSPPSGAAGSASAPASGGR